MKTNRRDFLRTAGWASLALLGLPRRARSKETLVPDPDQLLALAPGFSYRVIARTGEEMSDGLIMPGGPDGTGVFPGPNGRLILVRNHEQGAAPRGTQFLERRGDAVHRPSPQPSPKGEGVKLCYYSQRSSFGSHALFGIS